MYHGVRTINYKRKWLGEDTEYAECIDRRSMADELRCVW